MGADVGIKSFIKDRQVTGPAPDLPQHDPGVYFEQQDRWQCCFITTIMHDGPL